MSEKAKLPLDPIAHENADADAKPVLDKALAQVGFIPNMYSYMVNSTGLLDTYLLGYQHFREHSGLTPAEQEVVFLTISRENACHYCVTAHSMIADKMSKVPAEVIQALRDGGPIPEPKLSALSTFTRIMVESRGNPTATDIAAFKQAGYTETQVLEIVLAIAVKTLSNYANHLFDTPVDDMFSDYRWSADPSTAA